MKYAGYKPRHDDKFSQMSKMFAAAKDADGVDAMMVMLFLPDRSFDREDILVARERAVDALSNGNRSGNQSPVSTDDDRKA